MEVVRQVRACGQDQLLPMKRERLAGSRPDPWPRRLSLSEKTKQTDPVVIPDAGICHNLIGAATKRYPETPNRVAAEAAEDCTSIRKTTPAG